MSRKLGFLGRSIGLPGPVSLRFCELFCCPFYLRLVMYRIVVYIKRGDHEPPEEEHKNGGDENVVMLVQCPFSVAMILNCSRCDR